MEPENTKGTEVVVPWVEVGGKLRRADRLPAAVREAQRAWLEGDLVPVDEDYLPPSWPLHDDGGPLYGAE